jgi:sulfhydrogenase subunit gamma (sulfur reductase)
MNLYQPYLMRIEEIIDETIDVKTMRLSFRDPKVAEEFTFSAGQFGEYSVFGEGESTFCIASPPTRKGYIECSFKATGKVTRALRRLDVGDTIGFRGPYGNKFPLDTIMKGKSIVFIAGGIALAPVRCVIENVLDLRSEFKDVTVICGARSVADLVYKYKLEEWSKRDDMRLVACVDPGGETPDWKGEIGFVPNVVKKAAPTPEDTYAVICGPPVMIKYTLPVLSELGFPDDRIYTTLENRMKCGLGKCGRCNIGDKYVCKDGPVFTLTQIKNLPPEF